jgi:hypothetical protein
VSHSCLEPGLSIIIATVDSHGQPAACRGVAIASRDDLETVTVFVPVATGHETISNLAVTKRLSVAATHPITNSATQLKGATIEARLATEEEGAFVRSRLDAFAQMLLAYGVPPRLAHSMNHWPAFAVTIRVEQMFEQTPGPNAGKRIR